MVESWAVAILVLSLGTVFFLSGRKKRRPTQHDLDPTLKKNQIRITTQKKAFRREDLPPEYLASMQRRDIVEIPMGAQRPQIPQEKEPPTESEGKNWLPEHLKNDKKSKKR